MTAKSLNKSTYLLKSGNCCVTMTIDKGAPESCSIRHDNPYNGDFLVPVPETIMNNVRNVGGSNWLQTHGSCLLLRPLPLHVMVEDARVIWQILVNMGFVRV